MHGLENELVKLHKMKKKQQQQLYDLYQMKRWSSQDPHQTIVWKGT